MEALLPSTKWEESKMKRILFFLSCLFLVACSDSSSEPKRSTFCADDLNAFVDVDGALDKDSVVYFADTIGFTEVMHQFAKESKNRGDDSSSALSYNSFSETMSMDVSMRIEPSFDGGEITLECDSEHARPISFKYSKFPISSEDSLHRFTLDYEGKIKVNGTTYEDILVFDGLDGEMSGCNLKKFYYAANDGVVKVVSKNGVELNRISAEEFEAIADSVAQMIADSLAKAIEDSIAQAVEDSIAQALADSILAANPPAESGGSSDETDEKIDNLVDCVKDAYSSDKLSNFAKCISW